MCIRDRSYTNWQLCLADGSPDQKVEEYIQKRYGKDSRILYKHLETTEILLIVLNQSLPPLSISLYFKHLCPYILNPMSGQTRLYYNSCPSKSIKSYLLLY